MDSKDISWSSGLVGHTGNFPTGLLGIAVPVRCPWGSTLLQSCLRKYLEKLSQGGSRQHTLLQKATRIGHAEGYQSWRSALPLCYCAVFLSGFRRKLPFERGHILLAARCWREQNKQTKNCSLPDAESTPKPGREISSYATQFPLFTKLNIVLAI